jgi:hypothetical protein
VASDTKTRTIILADLVGSTSKVTRMETEQGADFLLDATQPIEDAIKQHDGRRRVRLVVVTETLGAAACFGKTH